MKAYLADSLLSILWVHDFSCVSDLTPPACAYVATHALWKYLSVSSSHCTWTQCLPLVCLFGERSKRAFGFEQLFQKEQLQIPFFLLHLSSCHGKAQGYWLSRTLTYTVNYFHLEWNLSGNGHYVARPLIHAFSFFCFFNGISISFLNPGVFLSATTTAVWEMFQFLELFLLKE